MAGAGSPGRSASVIGRPSAESVGSKRRGSVTWQDRNSSVAPPFAGSIIALTIEEETVSALEFLAILAALGLIAVVVFNWAHDTWLVQERNRNRFDLTGKSAQLMIGLKRLLGRGKEC